MEVEGDSVENPLDTFLAQNGSSDKARGISFKNTTERGVKLSYDRCIGEQILQCDEGIVSGRTPLDFEKILQQAFYRENSHRIVTDEATGEVGKSKEGLNVLD